MYITLSQRICYSFEQLPLYHLLRNRSMMSRSYCNCETVQWLEDRQKLQHHSRYWIQLYPMIAKKILSPYLNNITWKLKQKYLCINSHHSHARHVYSNSHQLRILYNDTCVSEIFTSPERDDSCAFVAITINAKSIDALRSMQRTLLELLVAWICSELLSTVTELDTGSLRNCNIEKAFESPLILLLYRCQLPVLQ